MFPLSGNARIAGLTKDLYLTGLQYNTAVTLFFPSYCLFEIPSQIVLKMIRPSLWLSILLFSWGIVSTHVSRINLADDRPRYGHDIDGTDR
jgi:hypothetical protein